MKRRIPNILAIFGLLCGLLGWGASPAGADERRRFELETRMMERINEARVDPLGTAAAMGLDPERILAGLPELREILIEGLPPLTFNAELRQAARAHSADMLARDFFGKFSPEGAGPEERVRSAGYWPNAAAETIGLLGFFNFVSPMDAVEDIFENLLRDELNPARSEPRLILSSYMEEIGIGFDAGPLTLNGTRFNVYLFTCDFGKPAVSKIEAEFVELINQARREPLKVAASLGFDPETLLAEREDIADILLHGLPPLELNGSLRDSAFMHGDDMLGNGYFSDCSPDGRCGDDRIREAGYSSDFVGSVLGSALLGAETPPDLGGRLLFEHRFRAELSGELDQGPVILHPGAKEVGVFVDSLVLFSDSNESSYSYHLVAGNFGAKWREVDRKATLKGMVFEDRNGDGLFNSGEGLSNVPIQISNVGEDSLWIYSDRVGAFSVFLSFGEYAVTVFPENRESGTEGVLLGNDDSYVVFSFGNEWQKSHSSH
jgi:hypothetical protein